jgi:hypothetical protein
MSNANPNDDAYEWPNDYFRSERVFRVARAARNLHRQLAGLRTKISSTPFFESAVLSAHDPKDTGELAVNFTHYEQPGKLSETKLRKLLESITLKDLAKFLTSKVLADYDMESKRDLLSFQEKLHAEDPNIDGDQMRAAYLKLVALYSRIPVRGYVSQQLNKLHFDTAQQASFFIVHTTVTGRDLQPVRIWPCYCDDQGLVATKQKVKEHKQERDENVPLFFEEILLHVVKLHQDASQPLIENAPPQHFHLFAIPVHTLHPSEKKRSYGTFLGWLYLTPSECWVEDPTNDYLKSVARPLVDNLWPLLDDFAVSLLDGEMEDRLDAFAHSSAQTPLEFVKAQIPSISGWKCADDPIPGQKDMGNGEYCAATLRNELLIILKHDSQRSPGITLKLVPKNFTIVPDASQTHLKKLREFGSRRFCHRIRSFYEQARLRQQEKEAAKLAGRVQEVSNQFRATSHELKNLVHLIPLAIEQKKQFILERFPALLLTFSLPAASKLSKSDRHCLPLAVCGFKKVEHLEVSCADYFEWLTEIIRMSAEVQCIAMPGKSRDMAQSVEQLEEWRNSIFSHFSISSEFKNMALPSDFTTLCLLGVSLTCAIRNIIQHSFSYDNVRAELWRYRLCHPITVELDGTTKLADWNSNMIAIHNDYQPKRGATEIREDGTNGAIAFYLSQIQHHIGRDLPLPFANSPVGETYQCLIPVLA